MIRIVQIKTLLFAFLCIAMVTANAKIKITSSNPITGTTDLVVGKKFYAAFDMVPTAVSNFDGAGDWMPPTSLPGTFSNYHFVSTQARLKLRVIEDQNSCLPNTFSVTVVVECRKYNTLGAFEGAENKTLTVTYNKAKGANYKAMDIAQFSNVFLLASKIISVSSASLTPFIMLDSELEVDFIRKLDFINAGNLSTMKVDIYNLSTSNATGGAGNITFNYNIHNTHFAEWADSVEIQWVHVDDEDYEVIPPSLVATFGSFNFNKGVSVVLPYYANALYRTYQISNIYDKGYLFFRVRAIGKAVSTSGGLITAINRVESNWSIPENEQQADISNTLFTDNYLEIGRFLPASNWQYNCVYAEDGKKKEVIAYFDGGYKNRQTITETNTNDEKYSIVKETIYDFQGRPAIEVLPVPIQNCSLIYVKNLNRNPSNLPYSAADFDYNVSSCSTATASMYTAAGAANYYSNNNTWLAATTNISSMHQFIPSSGNNNNANHYPFTQTIYTPDNTGRIAKTIQPGEAFKLGSGRETKYFYSNPTQAEIDRLFGEEIGYAPHYTKEMVSDPNGQISISFKSPSGQVVATALAGDPPNNVAAIDGATSSQKITENLLSSNQKSIENGFELNRQILVEKAATYKFRYSLNPETYAASCNTQVFCLDCAYDLEISITDECGIEKVPTANGKPLSKTIGPKLTADYNDNCETSAFNYTTASESYSSNQGFIEVSLSPGTYNIRRTIKVNQQSLEYYKANYFERAACKTLANFEAEVTANFDCDICAKYDTYKANKTASKAAYINARVANYLSLTNAEEAAKRAAFDAEFETMMEEAATYCEGGNPCDAYKAILITDVSPEGLYGQTDPSGPNYNKSVFNITSPGLGYSYKDIKFFNDKQVTLYGETFPRTLASLSPAELMSVWRDEYADELVVLHPEYYQYASCIEAKKSRQMDNGISNTMQYDDAAAKGYLKPVGTGLNDLNDEFLNLNIAQMTKTDFINAINTNAIAALSGSALTVTDIGLLPGNLSLKELTAYFILCKDATTPANRTNCISQALAGIANCDPSIKDLFWNTYKALYLSIKGRFYTLLSNENKLLQTPTYYSYSQGTINTELNFKDQYAKLITDKERFAEGNNNVVGGALDPSFSNQKCSTACESYADEWMAKLGNCNFSADPIIKAKEILDLRTALINVCIAGCDEKSPMGASTIRPGSANVDRSFADVIARLGYYEGGKCDASALTFPPPYGMPYSSHQEIGNNCGTKLKPYLIYGGCPKTIGTCVVENSNIATMLATIKNYSNTCPENQICRSCQDIRDVYALFYKYSSLSESDPSFEAEFTLFMNEKLDLNNSFTQYMAFMNDCLGYLGSTSFNTSQILEEFRYTFLIYKFDYSGLVVASLNQPYQQVDFKNEGYLLNNKYLNTASLAYKVPFYLNNKKGIYSNALWASNSNGITASMFNYTTNTDALMFAPPPAATAAVTPCACRKLQELKDQFDNSATGFPSYEAYLLSLGFDVPNASSILELCKQAFEQQRDLANQQAFDKTSDFTSEQGYLLGSLARAQGLEVPCVWCNNCPPDNGGGNPGNGGSVDAPWNPGHDVGKPPEPKVKDEIDACAALRTIIGNSFPGTKPIDLLNTNYAGNTDYALLFMLYNNVLSYNNTSTNVKFLAFDPQNLVYILEWYKRLLCNCGIAPEICGNSFPTESGPCPPIGSGTSTSKCTNCYAPDKKLLYIQKILNKLALSKTSSILTTKCNNINVQTNILVGRNITMPAYVPNEYGANTLFYNGAAQADLKWKAKINGKPNYEVLQIEITDNATTSTHKDFISLSLDNKGDLGIGFPYLNRILSVRPYYLYGSCGETRFFVVEAILRYNNVKTCISKDTIITLTGTYQRVITREINCAVKDIRLCTTVPSACEKMKALVIKSNAQLAYDRYITNTIEEQETKYIKKCLSFFGSSKETFTMEFSPNQYHFTLYYYDMAGNLIKTVPPAGVSVLNEIETNKIGQKKAGMSVTTTLPAHNLATHYTYNTLNQLVWQQTPDAGISRFGYDKVGRLILSRNAKQKRLADESDLFVHSYTIYDALGRITEVGEISSSGLEAIFDTPELLEQPSFITNNILNVTDKKEVTKTYYDYNPDPTEISYSLSNLRSRVAKVAYFNNNPTNNTIKPEHAVMYNYDVTGNVTQVIRYVKGLEVLNQHLKKVDYKFDVLSGKVESVAFQAGKIDQYIHHYKYDAENRLVKVLSSPRRELIDFSSTNAYGLRGLDASYEYYHHGPLARTELGELKVQGLDYAYTLQGWLKGVNSASLKPIDDMGKDAYTLDVNNTHKNIPADEMGFILNYHDKDYTQIQQNTSSLAQQNKFNGDILSTNAAFAGFAQQLYNGNISSMITAIGQLMSTTAGNGLVSAYQYDQLNRIREAKYFNKDASNVLVLNPNWNNRFTYDANGNIKTQLRDGAGATLAMDNLVYNYKPNTNQLNYVQDLNTNANNYADDIDDQKVSVTNTGRNNYEYDEIGNLIYDRAEEIASIEWTLYGKIKRITRTAGSLKPDLEFEYTPDGHRAVKILIPSVATKPRIYTYYMRDAQGNILATYQREFTKTIDYEVLDYVGVNAKLVSKVGMPGFANFIALKHQTNTTLLTNLEAAIKGTASKRTSFLSNSDAQAILQANTSSAQATIAAYNNWHFLQAIANYKGQHFLKVLNEEMQLRNAYTGSDMTLQTAIVSNSISLKIFFIEFKNSYEGNYQSTLSSLGIPITNTNDELDALEAALSTNGALAISNAIEENTDFTLLEPGYQMFSFVVSLWADNEDFRNTVIASISNFKSLLSLGATGSTYTPNGRLSIENTITALNNYDSYMLNTLARQYYVGGEDAMVTWFKINRPLDFTYQAVLVDANPVAPFQTANPTLYNTTAAGNGIKDYFVHIKTRFGQSIVDQMLSEYLPLNTQTLYVDELKISEWHIYGSSHLGIYKANILVANKEVHIIGNANGGTVNQNDYISSAINGLVSPVLSVSSFEQIRGAKNYELSNHLGNVLVTVSDKKIQVCSTSVLMRYAAEVVSANDYSPFGAPLATRTYKVEEAKYQLVNDDFTSTVTGWVANIPSAYTLVSENERLKFVASIPWAGVIRTFATTPGKKYHISLKVDMGTTQALYLIVRNVGNVNNTTVVATANGTYEINFVAQSTTTTLHLEGLNGTEQAPITGTRTYYIDDVLIQEVTNNGYRFGFNGKENDDETQTQDYGFRIYDYRLGRFLSIDPLIKDYPELTPYQFSMNRPIDGVDLDGLEWKSSIQMVDGKPKLTYTIDIQIINNTGNGTQPLTDYDKERINSIIEKTMQILSTSLDANVIINPVMVAEKGNNPFTVNLYSKEADPDKGGYSVGDTKYVGQTQSNEINLLYSIDTKGKGSFQVLPILEVARALAHELGHSAGLEHPWAIKDIRQDDANQNEPNVTNKTVLDNLMNSFENKDKDLQTDTGKKLTMGQKNVVKDTVTKQEPKK
jgi:RHS repeat-associated protein